MSVFDATLALINMLHVQPPRIVWIALAMCSLVLTGCTGPEASSSPRRDAALLLEAARESTRPEWQPDIGRLTESVHRRHFAPATAQAVLWAENLDGSGGSTLAQWRTIGTPQLKPTRIDARVGLEMANSAGQEECGLERDLDPGKLSGRDVQISLLAACLTPASVEALRGVRLSLASTDATGRQSEVFLPISMGSSPGWETLRWWVRFGPHVGPTTLRVHLMQPGALLTIGRLEMRGNDWLVAPTRATPGNASEQPQINLIAGGDFETGRRIFYSSSIRRWPNGDETVVPLAFEFEGEAVVGNRSLHVRPGEDSGRIGFGPLDLLRDRSPVGGAVIWHLKFYVRANRPAPITVSLRTRDRTLERSTFGAGPDWQAFTATLRAPADSMQDRVAMSAAELVFDLPGAASTEPLEWLLDGVSLTDTPARNYLQAEPVEVGITGPVPLSADLANLVSETNLTNFQIDLVENIARDPSATRPAGPAPTPGPAGKLALDVVDGWDRLVWTRTTAPVIQPGGKYSERISLPLPRGYYRLLATLWSEEPGLSRVISHDERATAVISFSDPVPLGNRFGMSTAGGCVSGYTTALGAGWVRLDLASQRVELKPGAWDFSPWTAQLNAVKQANVEWVAGLTLPLMERFRRTFLQQWLTANTLQPIGLVVSPPSISTRPAAEYLEQMAWVGELLAGNAGQTRVVCDVSALGVKPGQEAPPFPSTGNFVVGYASTDTALPERTEPLLEQIGRAYTNQTRIWDLSVPVRLGGSPQSGDWPELAAVFANAGDPMVRLEPPVDPLLSASRMVRAVLIRALAGAQLVCCDAVALAPPGSLFDRDVQRLHERDLSPRLGLVAFERMTSLLNDATLTRWIDQPDGCRVLLFEKDDRSAVAVVWRPFGWKPTYLALAGMPATVTVLDCLGNPDPILIDGHVRVIAANEIVRYILAPADQAALLSEAIASARIRAGVASTQATEGQPTGLP